MRGGVLKTALGEVSELSEGVRITNGASGELSKSQGRVEKDCQPILIHVH
jgi:hypothetical protein